MIVIYIVTAAVDEAYLLKALVWSPMQTLAL